jgi:uncharacterized protein (DUF1330 family)
MSENSTPRYLLGHAAPDDHDWLDALDRAAIGAGGARLALAPRSALSVFEGEWTGGGVGLWRFETPAELSKVALGTPKPGGFALSLPEGAGAARPADDAGFIVVQGMFTDMAKAAVYSQALPPIYAKYNGFYLALSRPDAITVLAGAWAPQAVVIAAFDSPDGPQTFWRSPEYTAAKALRAGGGNFLVVAFPAA